MARPRLPISDTVRGEILAEFRKYALSSQFIPNPHSFYENIMKPAGYEMSFSTFRDHWKDLQLDGLIRVDPKTGAIAAHDLPIIDTESDLPPET